MAITCGGNAKVTIAGVDLSDHVVSVELPVAVDEIDTTAMGPLGWRTKKGCLKEGTMSVEFQQDYAAGQVDATLWAALGSSVAFAVRSNATDPVSATNPEYTGAVIIAEYTPISSEPGSLSTVSVSWPVNGEIVRDVTP